jgi:hypothetical protein
MNDFRPGAAACPRTFWDALKRAPTNLASCGIRDSVVVTERETKSLDFKRKNESKEMQW